jgi:acetyl esterase/lipase
VPGSASPLAGDHPVQIGYLGPHAQQVPHLFHGRLHRICVDEDDSDGCLQTSPPPARRVPCQPRRSQEPTDAKFVGNEDSRPWESTKWTVSWSRDLSRQLHSRPREDHRTGPLPYILAFHGTLWMLAEAAVAASLVARCTCVYIVI